AQQNWSILPGGSGTCYLMNLASGQLLQSTGDPYHTHGGANVPSSSKVAATPPYHSNQQIWSLPASGSGVNLFNPINNQHVRATGDSYWSNTSQAYVSGCYQSALVPHASVSSQDQWNMVLRDGNYQIVARTSGTVLDCTGGGTGNGTAIELWTNLNNQYQTWRITYLNNGYYSIVNPNSGRSLDCTGYTGNDNTQIELWDYSGNAGQQWKFTMQADGGFTISPALTNANGVNDVLDGAACSGAAGAKIILWPWNGGTCQQEWNLTPL
ncbi:MAG: RICIN domain-containing protein, partial [Capsulimonas sp.]|uniref:RICIN domain-containing protein n=1 Tax=Capsulimonas sp. TaxID=2494211 RepID=UPI003263CFCB